MFDLILLLKENTCRNTLIELFDLYFICSKYECESYGKLVSNGSCYFDFDHSICCYYLPEELNKIPYNIADVCGISFCPFDVIYDIIQKLIEYDDNLFVDDDHDNIMSISEYKEKVLKKEVYPFIKKL